MSRIARRFAALRQEGRGGLVTYVTAGDPDLDLSWEIVSGLPAAGADLIELGMPFTDPMADGPAIQAGGQRALKAGVTLRKTLELVRRFRSQDAETPVVLMGYYNPIYIYGVEAFARDAAAAGIDGLILVDLPPEEAEELHPHLEAAGLDLVMLTAPTTDEKRLPAVLKYCSGFLYYVSILGVTGTRSAAEEAVRAAVSRLKRHTDLPVGVGFGIRTAAQAAAVAGIADAAVVGSVIVERIKEHLDADGRPQPGLAGSVHALVRELAAGVRGARQAAE